MIFSSFSTIPLVMLLLLEAGDAALGPEPAGAKHHDRKLRLPLFGRLLTVTFSGAIGRFDTHSSLITGELKTIETAYRRLDPLPLKTQSPIGETRRSRESAGA
jgi:hypothetical protein